MLEQWDADRKVALDLLKPSQKELEHGLELHRNSFVFDAYGFMPAGGGRDFNIDRLIAANASRDQLKDAREEFFKDTSFKAPEQLELLKAGWEYAGVDCIFQNSGVEGNDVERMLKRLSFFTHLIDRVPSLFEDRKSVV